MSQRVIVGLKPDIGVESVKIALGANGAESIQGPSRELPDVLIATIPDDQNIDEFIHIVRKVPGVRYAEPDSWQFTT